jgi:hypothetical protein
LTLPEKLGISREYRKGRYDLEGDPMKCPAWDS